MRNFSEQIEPINKKALASFKNEALNGTRMVPLFASECLLINAPLCQKNFNASTLWIYAKSSKFFACYGRVGKDIHFSIKFLSEIFKLALITSTIGCSNHGIKTFHNGSILQKHHGGPVHKITEDDSHFQLCGRHDHVSKMTMLVRWSYENRKFIGTNFGFHFHFCFRPASLSGYSNSWLIN